MSKLILSFLIAVAFASNVAAKDWRGIVPLHSTREDVEKLLGSPPPPPADGTRIYTLNKARSIYFLDEGEVYIVYAHQDIPDAVDCLGKVPEGTVLLIQITPKKEVRLTDLQLDKKRLRKFDPSEPKNIGYEAYLDAEEGLLVRAYKGRVDEICYLAKAEDKHFCPSYYENPKAFVQILIDF